MKAHLPNPISLRQSFFISLFLHLFLFLLLSLLLTKSPFKQEIEPIIVTIDAPSAMAEGTQAVPAPPSPKEKATPQQKPQPKTTTTTKQEAEKIVQQAKERLKKTTTTSKPVQSPQQTSESIPSTTSPIPQPVETEDDILAKSIEKALQSTGRRGTGTAAMPATGQQGTGTDPLGDANWRSRPRKTIFFPDIASKIKERVPNPLIGYSVTARIVFDNQGLAIKVDIVRSSGDPLIDSIFLAELKKIRVEAITEDRLDEITKTFKITVK